MVRRKYFAFTVVAKESAKDPIVFMRGDVVFHDHGTIKISPRYKALTPYGQQRWAQEQSNALGRSFIHLARPGICGSTGNHLNRRCEREVAIVDAGLDRLKAAFGWRHLNIVGQSGGGHLVASLMSRRTDINCAVISSGCVAVRLRNVLAGRDRDITGHESFFDPISHVATIARHPPKKCIVLTDRKDEIVWLQVQMAFVNALRKVGVRVDHRFVEALDDKHHDLWFAGVMAAFGYLESTEGAKA